MANIRTLTVSVKAQTRQFQRGMKRGGQSLSAFQLAVKSTTKGMRLFSGAFAGLVPALGVAAAARGLQTLTGAFGRFETAMAKVGVLLGDQRVLLPGLGREVQALSRRMGESTETLGAGLFDIISAGTKAGDAIELLTASTNLAKAGFSSTAVTADALTTILNSYGLAANQATTISDKLFAIQKLGKTDSTGWQAPSATLRPQLRSRA